MTNTNRMAQNGTGTPGKKEAAKKSNQKGQSVLGFSKKSFEFTLKL